MCRLYELYNEATGKKEGEVSAEKIENMDGEQLTLWIESLRMSNRFIVPLPGLFPRG